MAASASFSPKKEMPHLIPGTISRPADIFVPVWRDGLKTAFDITVVSPVQAAYLAKAAARPGADIDAAKLRTHEDNCRVEGISFVPLVVESFGGWDLDAARHLREMALCSARRTGAVPSITINHFFQRLSVVLQRGNAFLLDKDSVPSTHVLGI
jgi:hypothetical protein